MSRGTRNKIEDLRNHLFAALEGLSDPDNPMDIERAKAISDVGQTIINSAKLEIDYLKTVGGTRAATGFIPDESERPREASPFRPLRAIEGK